MRKQKQRKPLYQEHPRTDISFSSHNPRMRRGLKSQLMALESYEIKSDLELDG